MRYSKLITNLINNVRPDNPIHGHHYPYKWSLRDFIPAFRVRGLNRIIFLLFIFYLMFCK
jgi:hypothetical protein